MAEELIDKKAMAGFERLKTLLRNHESAVVAFSGGVDSSLLLNSAVAVLGHKMVLAVTFKSRLNPHGEISAAEKLAADLEVEHRVIELDPCSDSGFTANPPDRCYICKKLLFSHLLELAEKEGFNAVLEGSNADDPLDYRPGLRAIRELGVSSPLLEAGLGKPEIRHLARREGLPAWDKPSAACLASRIPYGEEITPEKLEQVAAAESYLREIGIRGNLRVRRHGNLARIEVDESAFRIVSTKCEKIEEELREIGFTYVTLDLSGFRSGSLNREIK